MDKKGTLIVIAGPTGSGKTDLAIDLSSRLGGAPIISADSRQVFREMAIGTAQPSAEQLCAAKHYFIADRDITSDYTCGCFEKEALALLYGLFGEHRHVMAVGGSGLYIDALCSGFDPLPPVDKVLRRQLETRLKEHGIDDLLEELRRRDPVYYDSVDRQNPARVMRGLEVCIVSGKPYSEQRSGRRNGRDFNIIKIGISMPREELYNRIDRRVEGMIAAGLEEEALALYPHRHLNALRTVGYREFFDYMSGDISRDEAIELIKRNTRHYAKRQMTWFNRDPEIKWFEKNDVDSIENYIKKFAE